MEFPLRNHHHQFTGSDHNLCVKSGIISNTEVEMDSKHKPRVTKKAVVPIQNQKYTDRTCNEKETRLMEE